MGLRLSYNRVWCRYNVMIARMYVQCCNWGGSSIQFKMFWMIQVKRQVVNVSSGPMGCWHSGALDGLPITCIGLGNLIHSLRFIFTRRVGLCKG